jgi:Tfp pilus assembly protein FimT
MRQRSISRGLTLLEILLVLGLLVVIGATVMPFVGGTLGNHRLRKSADMIRAEWLKARAKAMQTGRTYVFRYEPETDGYLVEPWYSDEDLLESSQVGLSSGLNSFAAPTQSFALSDTLDTAKTRHLPQDITFVASETTGEARDQIATQSGESLQMQDPTLAEPIFFYPDGTSSTARLLVMNERPRYILLTLRGLTGVVYVSEPMNAEQVQ